MIVIEIYEGKKKGRQSWRWRAIAGNNRKIANGGEAYTNQADCEQAVRDLFSGAIELHVPDKEAELIHTERQLR